MASEQEDAADDFPLVWVSDGQRELGRVYAAGRKFRTISGERELGTFSTLNEAKAAIADAAVRAALVADGSRSQPVTDDATFARKITTYEFSQRRRRGAA